MRRRQALGLLLLAALALAGCIGSESDTLGPQNVSAEVSEPTVPSFASPAELPHEEATSEPVIVSDEEGTLFVTAPTGGSEKPNVAEGAAWLWRSTDGGASWEVLRQPHREPADTDVAVSCSCDSDVAVGPDGWVYYTDWWMPGFAGVGNFLVEASADGGETWTSTPVTTPHATSVDRQWLVTGEDGFVGLFYHHSPVRAYTVSELPVLPEPAGIKAVFSTDHGQTWGQPVLVTEEDQGIFHQISKPVNVGEGTLAMAYGLMDYSDSDEFWTAPGEVRLAVSTDQGSSWEQRTVAEVPEGFDNLWAVQADADETGTVHVAWAARDGENMSTYHASTPDLGDTVDGPTELRSEGLNFLPWIAAQGEGEVAVGWYGSHATGDPQQAPNDTEWEAYLATRANRTADFAVTTVNEEPVKVGELCPRGAVCDEDRELLDYVGLTYDHEGRLHYSFAQSDTADESQPAAAIVHHTAEIVSESS